MKNLKSIVFSLMAVVMLTVFLSSCDKETLNDRADTMLEMSDTKTYELPSKFNNLSIEDLKNNLNSISKKEFQSLLSETTTDKIEERCSSRGKYIGYLCIWGVFYEIRERYCGPPNYGAYETYLVYKGSC